MYTVGVAVLTSRCKIFPIWIHTDVICVHTMCTFVHIVEQLVTPIVILDLSTAFDTVDHDLLLGVPATRFGIQGKALEWYSNYLKPRRFRVTIEEETSQPRLLDYSVPQGSIQGAFLFIVYTSTLDQVINSSQLELNGFTENHSVRSSFKPSKTRPYNRASNHHNHREIYARH